MYNFEFEYPYAFILLILIICIYKCPLSIKKIIFPHTNLFIQKVHWFNKEKLLYSLILISLITALASPISYNSKYSQQRKGRDLVFAIDTSGSMSEYGYSNTTMQESKFSILQNIIKNFIKKRFDDNVGVVVFGSFAFSPVPITYDMYSLAYMLNLLEVGMAGNSTAIGDGIMQALDLLKKSNAKSKVIILITDGYQNSGRTKIKDAVKLAKKLHVKIYTIGLGKESTYDKKLLQKISTDTDGASFSAKDKEALEDVYKKLNTLEPSSIRSQHYLNKKMLFIWPLALAILLLLYILTKRKV